MKNPSPDLAISEDIEDELDAAEWELTLAQAHHDRQLINLLNRRTQRLRKQLVNMYETHDGRIRSTTNK